MVCEISNKANDDINDIWVYTLNNWSIEQADRYYNLILDGIGFISKNFRIGKSLAHIKKEYRYLKVQSHYIFYRKTNSNTIEIIRVLHQKMDIENFLNQ